MIVKKGLKRGIRGDDSTPALPKGREGFSDRRFSVIIAFAQDDCGGWMKTIDLSKKFTGGEGRYTADVLFEQGAVKVRRIELGAGAIIPPCRMQEDVVFVVIEGRVVFRDDDGEAVVAAPGAVFIPGGATTRSMEAMVASVVLGVLYRREPARRGEQGAAGGT
jgi:hypothetical protein